MSKKSGVKCTEICKCDEDECLNQINHFETGPNEMEEDEEEED